MKRKNSTQNFPEKVEKSRKPATPSSGHLENLIADVKSFVKEVKQLLRNETTFLTGLTKLRDALRKKEGKGFNVYAEFVKDNSECPEIYKVIEKGRQSQAPLELQIAIEVLEQLLLHSASNTSYSSIGMYHVRRIIQNHLKLLYSCLNPTCHSNMVKGTLKLLVAMVAQGSFAAREIVGVFDFTLKAFGGLVNKADTKNDENIRTCFIKFIMSFLTFGDDASIRHILDVKGLVSSIFKLLSKDPPHVIAMVIKTLHEKVVKNSQIPKKSKVQLFSSYVLTQLSNLYKYSTNNDDDDDSDTANVRELTHALLQDVCCTFKYGICFVNKQGMFAGRSNNPVLLRFLQTIPKIDHGPSLQQFIIKILMCCPDLVQPYLTSLKITYEPRLSLPWLANINFLIKIYSALPLPSVMISKSSIDITKETFLQLSLNTVIPSVLTRTNLNHGIQHASLLVKNTTLSLISLVLNRASDLLDFCKKNMPSAKMEMFIQLFTDEVIKALPDVKTVLSLRQNLVSSLEGEKEVNDEEIKDDGDSIQLTKQCGPSLLLSQIIQVVYYYQKVQPFILSSIAFDMSKLLPRQQQDINQNIFPRFVQYYTLKILLELPRGTFKWQNQKTKNGPSNVYSILKILVHSDGPEVRGASEELVNKLLQDEGIIDSNTREVEIWLKHFYNNSLKKHQESLVRFLDSVLHAVAMEPYRYTDIVMEMSSQAHQEGDILYFQNARDERVSFSPLVVRALMSYVEMMSSHDGYTTDQLGSVAKYINLVVLDFLRIMVNPLPLMLTVKRFYGDMLLPNELTSLHNTHSSLLQYVGWWTGTPNVVGSKRMKRESVNLDENSGWARFETAHNPKSEVTMATGSHSITGTCHTDGVYVMLTLDHLGSYEKLFVYRHQPQRVSTTSFLHSVAPTPLVK